MRRLHDAFGRFAAVAVEGHFVFSVPACQHAVEGLLEPLAAFGFRPEHLSILDDAVGIITRSAAITDDLPGYALVWVIAQVNRLERKPGRWIFLYVDAFGVLQVLCDLKREKTAIVVMFENRRIGNAQRTIKRFLGGADALVRESERLCIGEIKRGREIDR